MPLESASYIYDLVSSNPPDSDLVMQGDDHLRLIKKVLQQTWPNITGPGLAVTAGTANAQTVSFTYAPTAYASGMRIMFKAGLTNTAAATINVNSIGAVPLLAAGVALPANGVVAGQSYIAVYDPALGGFNIISQSGSFLPLTGGSLSGTLVAPQFYATGNMIVATPAATPALPAVYYALVTNVREWYWGVRSDGIFYIVDVGAGLERFHIDLAGNALFLNSCTVNGNFNSNQIAGTTLIANSSIQCNTTGGTQAFYYSQNGVRSWGWGTQGNGFLSFVDDGAGATRFYLDLSGNAIIPGGHLNVADGGVAYTTWSAATIGLKWTGSASNLRLMVNGGDQGAFFIQTSDERMKENIKEAEGDALAELKGLELRSFDFKQEYGGAHYSQGLIAQEVQKIIPEAVTHGDSPDDKLGIDPMALLVRCIGAIQQLTARVEELEAQLARR